MYTAHKLVKIHSISKYLPIIPKYLRRFTHGGKGLMTLSNAGDQNGGPPFSSLTHFMSMNDE